MNDISAIATADIATQNARQIQALSNAASENIDMFV